MTNCYTRRLDQDEFTHLEDELKGLDPKQTFIFGNLTYGDDFHRNFFAPDKEGGFGKTQYYLKEADKSSEMGVIFFGEVCPMSMGTMLSAKGNHFIGKKSPKVRILLLAAFYYHGLI